MNLIFNIIGSVNDRGSYERYYDDQIKNEIDSMLNKIDIVRDAICNKD